MPRPSSCPASWRCCWSGCWSGGCWGGGHDVPFLLLGEPGREIVAQRAGRRIINAQRAAAGGSRHVEAAVTARTRAILPIHLALTLLAPAGRLGAEPSPSAERSKRVEAVRGIPGLVAFWDFVLRETEARRREMNMRTFGDLLTAMWSAEAFVLSAARVPLPPGTPRPVDDLFLGMV